MKSAENLNTGLSWNQDIRRLQEEIRRLRIIAVVNGAYEITNNGTSLVCSPAAETTGSVAAGTAVWA